MGLSFEKWEKTRHKATLFGMYVSGEFRGLGLGSKLVNYALDYAKSRPDTRLIQLTVSEGNRSAQALYERCGFMQFGCEPYAIAVGGGFVSKIHMWRELMPGTLPASQR